MRVFIRYKIFIALIFFIFLVIGKIFYGARKEYRMAEGFLKEGKHLSAITHYQRSMKWYLPVIGYTGISAQRLWEIGEFLEGAGDIKTALISYRNLRSGFYSVRSFYNPGEGWIKRCDEKIRSLSGEVIYHASSPDMTGTLFTLLGTLGWISCVLFFILNNDGLEVFLHDKKIKPSIILLFVVCCAVWVIGMLMA